MVEENDRDQDFQEDAITEEDEITAALAVLDKATEPIESPTPTRQASDESEPCDEDDDLADWAKTGRSRSPAIGSSARYCLRGDQLCPETVAAPIKLETVMESEQDPDPELQLEPALQPAPEPKAQLEPAPEQKVSWLLQVPLLTMPPLMQAADWNVRLPPADPGGDQLLRQIGAKSPEPQPESANPQSLLAKLDDLYGCTDKPFHADQPFEDEEVWELTEADMFDVQEIDPKTPPPLPLDC